LEFTFSKSNEINISKYRLKKIKAVLRKGLYHANVLDEPSKYAEESGIKDLTQTEATIFNLIYHTIKPYMPPVDEMSYISSQLPLVVFSNQIATASGNPGRISKVCPSISPATVVSLQVDAVVIYHLLLKIDEGFCCLKANDSKITNEKDAVWNKNRIFGAVFDLSRMQQICNKRRLEFIYNISIRPGMKTCVLLGEKSVPFVGDNTSFTKAAFASTLPDAPTRPITPEELDRTTTTIKALNDKLVRMKKEFSVHEHDRAIKELKKRWKTEESSRATLYEDIQNMKNNRNDIFKKVEKLRIELNHLKRQHYLMRQVHV
jgi:hypothetical protein